VGSFCRSELQLMQETTGRGLLLPVAGGSSRCARGRRQGTIHTQVTASVTKPEAVCSTVTNTFYFVRPAGICSKWRCACQCLRVGHLESGMLADRVLNAWRDVQICC
jgi:hypothetical protein